MKPIIELQGVKRYYKLSNEILIKAVDGVTLKINKGEFVTIFGPSGCGKSTLMHVIGLLDKPTEGTILINGQDTKGLSNKEVTNLRSSSIGFVFQFFFLSPNLTALENIEFPMALVNKSESYRYNRAKELLKLVKLADRTDHLPYQLSGGQKQRVAVARALANKPDLILADEPTGNLDSRTGKEVINLFTDLWKQGNTLVIVTHDPDLARLAPRTIEMLDGRIIKDQSNGHKKNKGGK